MYEKDEYYKALQESIDMLSIDDDANYEKFKLLKGICSGLLNEIEILSSEIENISVLNREIVETLKNISSR
ncbi:hypothetical protein LS48_09085 [Aequorivita aquimaris]|uniref:Uncharacterized protein n=1 Tax=Aequorivita aquimaris TaxID=1548749 RepID=A0A137RGU1_9FLAO|nr:hypothetical protein [Aequorivita aquimaris]KXN98707.1 hypothetical protein LS48_09085 [Aequorivita aquimaris]